LRRGGKIAIWLNLVSVLRSDADRTTKAATVIDTALELTPRAWGMYMIGKSIYGAWLSGDLTVSERLWSAGTWALSLWLDVAWLFSFWAGNVASAVLKSSPKLVKVAKSVGTVSTKIGKWLVRWYSAYAGITLATHASTFLLDTTNGVIDNHIKDQQSKADHSHDAINQ
jgi:hypothetical protein